MRGSQGTKLVRTDCVLAKPTLARGPESGRLLLYLLGMEANRVVSAIEMVAKVSGSGDISFASKAFKRASSIRALRLVQKNDAIAYGVGRVTKGMSDKPKVGETEEQRAKERHRTVSAMSGHGLMLQARASRTLKGKAFRDGQTSSSRCIVWRIVADRRGCVSTRSSIAGYTTNVEQTKKEVLRGFVRRRFAQKCANNARSERSAAPFCGPMFPPVTRSEAKQAKHRGKCVQGFRQRLPVQTAQKLRELLKGQVAKAGQADVIDRWIRLKQVVEERAFSSQHDTMNRKDFVFPRALRRKRASMCSLTINTDLKRHIFVATVEPWRRF